MPGDMTVRGLDAVRRKFKALSPSIMTSIARVGMPAASRLVAGAARANAPSKTGKLRDSISPSADAPRTNMVRMRIIATAPEAAPTELGTRKEHAQPFLRPALKQNHAAVVSILTDAVSLGIKDT